MGVVVCKEKHASKGNHCSSRSCSSIPLHEDKHVILCRGIVSWLVHSACPVTQPKRINDSILLGADHEGNPIKRSQVWNPPNNWCIQSCASYHNHPSTTPIPSCTLTWGQANRLHRNPLESWRTFFGVHVNLQEHKAAPPPHPSLPHREQLRNACLAQQVRQLWVDALQC